MKPITLVLALGLALAAPYTQAKELTPQQKLMGTCNAEAKGLKGEEHKKKMSTCLADGRKRQQEVMKACAAENKGKKGAEYKAAQKECLTKG
jgi:hypothetical protein